MKKKNKLDKNKKDNKNNSNNNSNVGYKNSINLYNDKNSNIQNNEKELNNINNNNNVKMDFININNNKNDKIFGVVYKNKKKNTNIINVNVEQKKDIFGIIQNIEYFDEQKYKNDGQKYKNDDNEEILTTKEIYGIKKRDYKSISTEQLFKDLNKDNISLEKFDNINVINNNIKINKINKNKFVKNINDIVCMVCYARNKHITKLCPEQICKICYKKGHSTSNCIYKPIICQYCNKDLNPNNHINDNIVFHKDKWDCPKRKYFINCSY